MKKMTRLGRVAIGGLFVLNLSCINLLAEEHPAVTALLKNGNPFIQNTILPNIEKYRMGDYTLEFVGAGGAPVKDLKVSVELKRHQFLFGVCPPEWSSTNNPKVVEAWGNLFNFGVVSTATKWASVEKEPGKYDYRRADKILALSKKYGVSLEYHFLTGYHPGWLASLPDDQKAERQKAYAFDAIKRYRNDFAFFEVYNEDWLTHLKNAKVYFDQTAFFKELTGKFPDVKFGIADCWRLDDSAPFPEPAVVKERYPGIAFLSVHAHQPRRIWANPQQMYANFDKYLDSGVKIHISEFGINSGEIEGGYRKGVWTDELKAEYFVEAYACAFSHPAVEAINNWEIGPGTKIFMNFNALLNDDFSPNTAYLALQDLIQRKFSTKLSASCDPAGRVTFKGFHGRYNITVEHPTAGQKSFTVELSPEHKVQRLNID